MLQNLPRLIVHRWSALLFWIVTLSVSSFANAAEAVPVPPSIDMTNVRVRLAPNMTGPERKAVEMLFDEVEKRSYVRWAESSAPDKGTGPILLIGEREELRRAFPAQFRLAATSADARPEGYELDSSDPEVVIIAGNDARGVLYGVGRLLRLMDYSRGKITLAKGVQICTSPRYAVRGHQLGYRPKTNSYDGWNVDMWEQYIRDLVIFGANAIELVPPRSDDDPDSPHFTLSKMQMMIEMSRLASEYGIQCWVWYPAIDRDYTDPATVEFALNEWRGVLSQLPRVDAIFVPGGDPGHTHPKPLFAMLAKQAAQLRQIHPQATWWVSPQGFSQEWMEEFYTLLDQGQDWLNGVVFGPQQRESLEGLRARVPASYGMRFYPDITHSLRAQYPVTNWDYAYAMTLNREPINPRPVDQAAIFRRLQPLAEAGFITYSEGCNDDVNKFVWSGLGWDPDQSVPDLLRDFAHYFIGEPLSEGFAQALLSLERNWRGPLLTNTGVDVTLAQVQELERAATPAVRQNWRFQQVLYRAYYDAYIRARLIGETAQEVRAVEQLRRAPTIGSETAMAAAEVALALPEVPPGADRRQRVFELAEGLFQSIHMQLSVPRYLAIAERRGANLDRIDNNLNNAPWWRVQFARVRQMDAESARLAALDALVNWTNPGPGGFYDDLGRPVEQPHLVSDLSYEEDPAHLRHPMSAFALRRENPTARISSATFSEVLTEHPLDMVYPDLDKTARYRLRIVYSNENNSARGNVIQVRLVANERYEVHGPMAKPGDMSPLEFDVPPAATQSGELRLRWTRQGGLGGNGRGVQIAEIWLMRVNNLPSYERSAPYGY